MLTTQSGTTRKQGLNTKMPTAGTAGSPKVACIGLLMSSQRKTADFRIGGDGVIVVPTVTENGMGRVTGSFSAIRKLSTKAGRNNSARRGSVKAEMANQDKKLLSIKAVSNILNLVSAYETIKSKKGNMTPGMDGTTLDGINLK